MYMRLVGCRIQVVADIHARAGLRSVAWRSRSLRPTISRWQITYEGVDLFKPFVGDLDMALDPIKRLVYLAWIPGRGYTATG
jgi:hypothetical protein